MSTADAYSSDHLVLSHFGNCVCSYVETDLSETCFWTLNFECPSVLLFYFGIRPFQISITLSKVNCCSGTNGLTNVSIISLLELFGLNTETITDNAISTRQKQKQKMCVEHTCIHLYASFPQSRLQPCNDLDLRPLTCRVKKIISILM